MNVDIELTEKNEYPSDFYILLKYKSTKRCIDEEFFCESLYYGLLSSIIEYLLRKANLDSFKEYFDIDVIPFAIYLNRLSSPFVNIDGRKKNIKLAIEWYKLHHSYDKDYGDVYIMGWLEQMYVCLCVIEQVPDPKQRKETFLNVYLKRFEKKHTSSPLHINTNYRKFETKDEWREDRADLVSYPEYDIIKPSVQWYPPKEDFMDMLTNGLTTYYDHLLYSIYTTIEDAAYKHYNIPIQENMNQLWDQYFKVKEQSIKQKERQWGYAQTDSILTKGEFSKEHQKKAIQAYIELEDLEKKHKEDSCIPYLLLNCALMNMPKFENFYRYHCCVNIMNRISGIKDLVDTNLIKSWCEQIINICFININSKHIFMLSLDPVFYHNTKFYLPRSYDDNGVPYTKDEEQIVSSHNEIALVLKWIYKRYGSTSDIRNRGRYIHIPKRHLTKYEWERDSVQNAKNYLKYQYSIQKDPEMLEDMESIEERHSIEEEEKYREICVMDTLYELHLHKNLKLHTKIEDHTEMWTKYAKKRREKQRQKEIETKEERLRNEYERKRQEQLELELWRERDWRKRMYEKRKSQRVAVSFNLPNGMTGEPKEKRSLKEQRKIENKFLSFGEHSQSDRYM